MQLVPISIEGRSVCKICNCVYFPRYCVTRYFVAELVSDRLTSFSFKSASIVMEATTTWLRRHCSMDTVEKFGKKMGTDKIVNAMGVQHVDGAHIIVYGAVILAAALYLVGRQIRRSVPKATMSLRSRSPDPEKPTDVTTYAAKRMKPTERPPGSESR